MAKLWMNIMQTLQITHNLRTLPFSNEKSKIKHLISVVATKISLGLPNVLF